MKRKSITKRNVGIVSTNFENPKSSGYIIARDFLENFAIEFACTSSHYIGKHNILEFPHFGFKEKQLSTVLGLVFHKITDFHFPELPIVRKLTQPSRNENYEDSHGWIDYFCSYNGYIFLVEIKHSHISYKSCKPDQHSIDDLWRDLNRQIKSSKSEAYYYRDNYKCKGVFRLGLHIMPVYQSSTNKDFKLDFNETYLDELTANINMNFRPKPTFFSVTKCNSKEICTCP